jgi:REP element-mobilizing transposase RayT
MGRPLRDEAAGFHHVVTRGNNKRPIYADDRDRWFFSITVDRVARKYGWTVLAYCLMTNHYHLVLSVDERGLADGMRDLNTAHAFYFNVRHGRINHLFGKRYWNRRIKTDASLMNAVRYVVQNPRRAGGSRRLEEYPWSSYAATIGVVNAAMRLDRDTLLRVFGSTPTIALAEFRAYCAAMPFGGHVRCQAP